MNREEFLEGMDKSVYLLDYERQHDILRKHINSMQQWTPTYGTVNMVACMEEMSELIESLVEDDLTDPNENFDTIHLLEEMADVSNSLVILEIIFDIPSTVDIIGRSFRSKIYYELNSVGDRFVNVIVRDLSKMQRKLSKVIRSKKIDDRDCIKLLIQRIICEIDYLVDFYFSADPMVLETAINVKLERIEQRTNDMIAEHRKYAIGETTEDKIE